jgi:hypothetical protein
MDATIAATLFAALLFAGDVRPPPSETVSPPPPSYAYCIASTKASVLVSDVFTAPRSPNLDLLNASWLSYSTQLGGTLQTCGTISGTKVSAYSQLDTMAQDAAQEVRKSNHGGYVRINHTGWMSSN